MCCPFRDKENASLPNQPENRHPNNKAKHYHLKAEAGIRHLYSVRFLNRYLKYIKHFLYREIHMESTALSMNLGVIIVYFLKNGCRSSCVKASLISLMVSAFRLLRCLIRYPISSRMA